MAISEVHKENPDVMECSSQQARETEIVLDEQLWLRGDTWAMIYVQNYQSFRMWPLVDRDISGTRNHTECHTQTLAAFLRLCKRKYTLQQGSSRITSPEDDRQLAVTFNRNRKNNSCRYPRVPQFRGISCTVGCERRAYMLA